MYNKTIYKKKTKRDKNEPTATTELHAPDLRKAQTEYGRVQLVC